MKILYCHVEAAQRRFPQVWAQMQLLKEQGYPIEFELTTIKDDYSHWQAVNKYWGTDDIILLDQDIWVTKEMLDEIINCKEEACCYYFKSSPLYKAGTLTIGYRIADPEAWLQIAPPVPEYVKYVTASGNNFTKFSKWLQQKPLERYAVKTPANGMKGLAGDNAIMMNVNSWLRGGMLKYHLHRGPAPDGCGVEYHTLESDKVV